MIYGELLLDFGAKFQSFKIYNFQVAMATFVEKLNISRYHKDHQKPTLVSVISRPGYKNVINWYNCEIWK